jgi:putative transferase (TIGR04331 family)
LAARALEKKLFAQFCIFLNQYHCIEKSERFWKIYIGHWFRAAIDSLLNRVNTLEHCLQNYRITGCSVVSHKSYELATRDSLSGILAFDNDRWNSLLMGRILAHFDGIDFPVEVVSESSNDKIFSAYKNNVPKGIIRRKKILNHLYEKFAFIARAFSRNNDVFIISSYLPVIKEIVLELSFNQFPQKWISPKFVDTTKPKRLLRSKLSGKFAELSSGKRNKIIASLLFEIVPTSYLEGFPNLNNFVDKQAWPDAPKLIFTSNSFFVADVFKLWTAKKIEGGSRYIVGQHGNNYGTHRYMNPSVEEETADSFLTWGWTDGLEQHIPAFVFKTAGIKKGYYNPKGGMLLIENHLPHRNFIWDTHVTFGRYFDDQLDFVSRLSDMPKKHLTVRLHNGYRNLSWGEVERWRDYEPNMRIDKGDTKLKKLVQSSRLVIHSYDSTGILETLSLNIPTIAFWQDGFDHLRESAKPFYQLLVDAGIVHLSPRAAADHVNNIWDRVDDWWLSTDVQEARRLFCMRYARTSATPVRDLNKILKNSVS